MNLAEDPRGAAVRMEEALLPRQCPRGDGLAVVTVPAVSAAGEWEAREGRGPEAGHSPASLKELVL